MVEYHPSKVNVDGSSPLARSSLVGNGLNCPDSSGVEHFLGKEEVSGSIPDLGSIKGLYKSFYIKLVKIGELFFKLTHHKFLIKITAYRRA